MKAGINHSDQGCMQECYWSASIGFIGCRWGPIVLLVLVSLAVMVSVHITKTETAAKIQIDDAVQVISSAYHYKNRLHPESGL